jgi:MoaA/NifB/PqqE/SkfB family radical SAM enzyme
MPTYEIEWIIDEMSRDGKTMGEVRWFLNGDATTDQRLPDIYRLSKKKCPWLKTNNFTNGVLYEKRDMLVDKNLDEIAFTISAHTPELYRLVHRGDRFEDVIRGCDTNP